jgi:hypothetical protein
MISLLKKFITGKQKIRIVLLLVLCIQLALYLFLYQRARWITPPGHVYALQNIEGYYSDVIRQSKLGAWSHTFSFTTLPTPKIYTYLFFIGAGKIAALFNIDPVVMYEITHITGAIAVFVSAFWLITLLLPAGLQIPAIIFTMMFETGPVWGQWTTVWFLPPMLSQHFGLAHHLWSQAIGLTLICIIIRSIQKPSWITMILIGMLAVIGPLAEPTYFIILITCLFPPWLIYSAVTKNLKKTILPIAIATVGICCAGLFTKWQISISSPWDTFFAVEKSWWTTDYILNPFIQSFSFYYPFILVLLVLTPLSWKKWSTTMQRTFILALCWSILPIGLILLSTASWIPVSNGRIASSLSPIPIGILATLTLYAAGKIEYFRRPAQWLVTFLFLLCFGVSMFFSVSYFNQLIQAQNNNRYSWTIYPTVDLWKGMMALKKAPVWSHVMVLPSIGDILPIYVPVRVYQAWLHGNTDWPYRRGLSHIFYTGEMPPDQLRKLFTENNISYVFYGPEEILATKTTTFYPDVLDVFYANPVVTIYKVRALPK